MTTCKECKFYSTVEGARTPYIDRCRRYPKSEIVREDHWCGEFVGKTDEVQTKGKCEHEWANYFCLSMPTQVRCKKCGKKAHTRFALK